MAGEEIQVAQILLAALLGGIIGWEREKRGRPAGIRTHVLVATAAALFTAIGIAFDPSDPLRVAANVVTGIGFLGAGMIIRDRGGVHGLTTAASIWGVAALGTAVALGFYVLALVSAAIMFFIPFVPHMHPVHVESSKSTKRR